jgi:Uma2 family endonuclease
MNPRESGGGATTRRPDRLSDQLSKSASSDCKMAAPASVLRRHADPIPIHRLSLPSVRQPRRAGGGVRAAAHATLDPMATAVKTRRWTREDYYRMAEVGLLEPAERTELLDGVIYTMSPQGSVHSAIVEVVSNVVRSVYPGHSVRTHSPLALGEYSEPEPDIAVLSGSPRDYLSKLPTAALLVIEVAVTSLRHDRLRKLPIYARSGVPEAWIIDIGQQTVEVYRDPAGDVYRSRTVLRAGDHVSPLSRPEASIPIADLLP